jgi:hypothetical protein
MPHESKDIPDSADHIKPGSWQGNVKLRDVSLQTSWNSGQRIMEQEFEGLKHLLYEIDNLEGIDILSPFGTLLFDVPLADVRVLKLQVQLVPLLMKLLTLELMK